MSRKKHPRSDDRLPAREQLDLMSAPAQLPSPGEVLDAAFPHLTAAGPAVEVEVEDVVYADPVQPHAPATMMILGPDGNPQEIAYTNIDPATAAVANFTAAGVGYTPTEVKPQTFEAVLAFGDIPDAPRTEADELRLQIARLEAKIAGHELLEQESRRLRDMIRELQERDIATTKASFDREPSLLDLEMHRATLEDARIWQIMPSRSATQNGCPPKIYVVARHPGEAVQKALDAKHVFNAADVENVTVLGGPAVV